MACDGYDITLSFDESSETDSAIYSDSAESDEMDCPDLPAMSCQCNMRKGIKLEMWRHSSTMKNVVNIIIALNRMTHIKATSSEFGEEEVLNIIMDDVIQECRMNEFAVTPSYTKTSRSLQCNICDQFKKTLVKSAASPHLLAVTLRDRNSQYKVEFSLSMYVSASASKSASQPVCLGISKTKLYLSCAMSDGSSTPHLVLKEVDGTLNTIKAGDANDNLLFYRTETGVANNTFESVKYPGWFISTAYEDSEQVEMSQISSDRITNFSLVNSNSNEMRLSIYSKRESTECNGGQLVVAVRVNPTHMISRDTQATGVRGCTIL